MTYELAVFHVEEGHGLRKRQSPSGNAMVNMLFRSALQHDQDVHLTVLTNAATDLSAVEVAFARVHRNVDPKNLMLERTRSQLDHMRSRDWAHPLLLIDSDILINSEIGSVFSDDFDIGLTWRPHPDMPFNGGVIFVNNLRPDLVRAFFERLLRTYEHEFEKDAHWFGDQRALARAVDLQPGDAADAGLLVRNGLTFKLFSCDEFNYSPPNRVAAALAGPRGRRIIHFKGKRKWMMEPFWDFHISAAAGHRTGASMAKAVLQILRAKLAARH